jgi:threonine synthase
MIKYKCSLCNKIFNRNEVKYLCPDCSKDYKQGIPLKGVLEVVLDYEYIKRKFNKSNPDWNLFSAVEPEYFPKYPVGNTPFFRIDNFGKEYGFENLWIKNDGLNPSGSLKDRASFIVVAEANRLKENNIVTASTGNAASALAAVCASDKKKAIIFVPESAPKAKLVQMYLYSAKVIKVKGTYDDAFSLSLEYTKNNPGLNRNTAYHPLTIEGKKTAGLEIFEQNNFKIPDVILIPVGDGVIISGVYKAFYDLRKAGLIEKLPRLICVQAEKSNAIHNFIQTGIYKNAENPNTIADSISVSVPSNAYMAKKTVEESKGFSITVSDDEILKAQKTLASKTGIFAEPSSSAIVAALLKLKSSELLDKKEQIVLLITGNGLKDVESIQIF